MYLTGQHPIVPAPWRVKDVTHVALAFMRSETFNDLERSSWPLFLEVEKVREKFPKETKVMVAIGGWGNEEGFRESASTAEGREAWAENVRRMVESTGADGIDIDWEYPGGNGEDYKRVPNSEREWEITAYPHLLSSLRQALGPSKVISAAVPGLPRDMLAFTPSTIPSIIASVDFLNIMTYDLMNRRDNVTKHHTGVQNSLEAIDAYIATGVPPSKANFGLAFYVKWFKTDPASRKTCVMQPLGCKTALMEDPDTGADLGKAGAFSWHDKCPVDLESSFRDSWIHGEYDKIGGGYYYFDRDEDLFWSYDRPRDIIKKVVPILEKRGVGGVFAWGLGEDAPKFEHLNAANMALADWEDERLGRSEL
ncbi:glycoside hydrolase [Bimuria novae-zelandiae CBS 107.79]|uniref:chitinase n=1 Tax=Bimuria novae-zelandiae CBS 107.79 TaxID=1447943 RepID=A0A6A5UPD5_9PLEO|nr:glycoside hydrolase [Bimuria novae-zelandiae CBS 107.79]